MELSVFPLQLSGIALVTGTDQDRSGDMQTLFCHEVPHEHARNAASSKIIILLGFVR